MANRDKKWFTRDLFFGVLDFWLVLDFWFSWLFCLWFWRGFTRWLWSNVYITSNVVWANRNEWGGALGYFTIHWAWIGDSKREAYKYKVDSMSRWEWSSFCSTFSTLLLLCWFQGLCFADPFICFCFLLFIYHRQKGLALLSIPQGQIASVPVNLEFFGMWQKLPEEWADFELDFADLGKAALHILKVATFLRFRMVSPVCTHGTNLFYTLKHEGSIVMP